MGGLFVGQLVRVRGALGVTDFFAGGEPLLLSSPGADAEEGSLIEARRSDGSAIPTGRLLCHAHSALEAVYRLAKKHHLDPSPSLEAEREADAWAKAPGFDDERLVDRTAWPFVTIDNEDSKDLDQALFLEDAPNGRVRAHYALADASYFVRPGTALFDAAISKGASFYFPGFSVPMLPRVLSENIISLNEGEPRRALLLSIEIDAAGRVYDTTIERALIRSRRKLSYDGAQVLFDQPRSDPCFSEEIDRSLRLLQTLGVRRIEEADRRHVVRYERAEVDIAFADREHMRFCMIERSRNDVERWNEQLSLLANIEGARFLLGDQAEQPNVQPVFRVHEAPPESRVRELRSLIGGIASAHALGSDFAWSQTESLAAYLTRLPTKGPQARLTTAIHRQAVVINRRSEFAPDAGPHFGIGAESYSRFSAPMREVVGIFTHKEAFEKLHGSGHGSGAADERLRDEIVEAANRSKSIQKKLDKECYELVIDQVFRADMDRAESARPIRVGTVLGLSDKKVYARLDDPPLELKLYREDLEKAAGCGLTLAREGAELVTERGDDRIRIGDELRIRVSAHERNKWRFRRV